MIPVTITIIPIILLIEIEVLVVPNKPIDSMIMAEKSATVYR